MAVVQQQAQRRRWGMVDAAALEGGEMTSARKAYAQKKDYRGLQRIRQLQRMQSPTIRKAMACADVGHIDEAKKLLLAEDRVDILISILCGCGRFEDALYYMGKHPGAVSKAIEDSTRVD